MSQPNILLITTDQQRYDSAGINGAGFLTTPAFDRLGTEGVNCARAYCSNPVCTPSRVSLMTGLHLSRHGSYNIGTEPTGYDHFLSTVLREHGYETMHIGKGHWHPWGAEATDSPESRQQPEENFAQPWKDFAGFETAELSIGHVLGGIRGHYRHWFRERGADPDGFEARPLFGEEDPNQTGDWTLPTELHSSTWTADRTIEFLRNRDKDRPFFLHAGFQDPHHPHIVPLDFEGRLEPEEVPLPSIPQGPETNELPLHDLFRNNELQGSRFRGRFEIAGQGATPWGAFFADEQKSRATRAHYYSMIHLVDRNLGRILDALDHHGLAENTLVVFTSDHGEMLGDHGIGQKGPLGYESVLQVPLWMRAPSLWKGGEFKECVSLVDLYPTFLAAAGIPLPRRVDGVNLLAALRDGDPLGRDGVRVEYKEEPDRIRYRGFITERWKLILYTGEAFGELYDRDNDPEEYHNLFADPDYAPVRERLTRMILDDMERSEPINPRPSRA